MDPQFHICVEIKFAAVTHQSTGLTDNEFYALKRSIYKKLDRTHLCPIQALATPDYWKHFGGKKPGRSETEPFFQKVKNRLPSSI